ncbi:uncharacterized protein LOC111703259 [Eurytemora carolleeae]|uniref:uncharacterized protein LOC111703259 n=1 Tax=Eurytemora carolleeae TaxID=1294199 RepID=UPI000C757EB1|nr:uncharacterized protein LOC111703259 [Eurytemora carolleeae]|eukprot:XP_023330918.1 uncharacterized protein LOC111703259 [Eurytemora affinis]
MFSKKELFLTILLSSILTESSGTYFLQTVKKPGQDKLKQYLVKLKQPSEIEPVSDIDLHVENNENERDYANSESEEPKMLIDLNPSVTECEKWHYISCQIVGVDSSILGEENIFLPGNIVMKLIEKKNEFYQYSGTDSTFRATIDAKTKGIDGIATFSGKRKFVLKSVPTLGHLWIEIDQTKV